ARPTSLAPCGRKTAKACDAASFIAGSANTASGRTACRDAEEIRGRYLRTDDIAGPSPRGGASWVNTAGCPGVPAERIAKCVMGARLACLCGSCQVLDKFAQKHLD